jgi:hypothetical protein
VILIISLNKIVLDNIGEIYVQQQRFIEARKKNMMKQLMYLNKHYQVIIVLLVKLTIILANSSVALMHLIKH